MDNTAYKCLKEYSDKKQVIFIGEMAGCTADEDFTKNFIISGKLENYQPWDMLWDQIYFGKVRKQKKTLKNIFS
jgi:hypothetical protein